MNVFISLKLGQFTSLLSGYKAKAIIGSHNEVPFIPSLKNALIEQDIIISKPNCNAKWSYPTITLCNNVEDLLSSLLLIQLRSSSCKGFPPAAIMRPVVIGGIFVMWNNLKLCLNM